MHFKFLQFQINPAEVRKIDFVKPKHASKRKGQVNSQPDAVAKHMKTNSPQIPSEIMYNAVYAVPNACLFTIVPEPDHILAQPATLSVTLSSTVTTPSSPLVIQSTVASLPVTQSTDTSLPFTQSTVTSLPVTQSTVTSLPVTQSTVTSLPVTQSTVTSLPVTQSTVTSLPVTQSTDTLPPVTQSTDTLPPVTQLTVTSHVSTMSSVCLLPKCLIDLYDTQYKVLNKELLLKKSQEIFRSISFTVNQCKIIEQVTRSQRQSTEWYNQRRGRITASLFHDIFAFKEKEDPVNLLKRLLQP